MQSAGNLGLADASTEEVLYLDLMPRCGWRSTQPLSILPGPAVFPASSSSLPSVVNRAKHGDGLFHSKSLPLHGKTLPFQVQILPKTNL